MKKSFLLSLILFSVSFSFFSCSTLVKEEFARKKYYDFPKTKNKPDAVHEVLISHSNVKEPQNQGFEKNVVPLKIASMETNPRESETAAGLDLKSITAVSHQEHLPFLKRKNI